jgi:hypothetical protein
MEDSPRYLIVHVGNPSNLERALKSKLQPGDRVVSVYPYTAEPKRFSELSMRALGGVMLEALIELRHPSWKEKGVGFTAGEEKEA